MTGAERKSSDVYAHRAETALRHISLGAAISHFQYYLMLVLKLLIFSLVP